MTVIVRFAPSPTGYLHIGGARTALFNWLFARHHGGKFLLRIEDTDRERSTAAAVAAIIDGLTWLELDWDGEPVLQSKRIERHQAAAHQLLAAGKAYRCYCSPEELQAMRDAAKAAGRPVGYDGTWRDRDPALAPPGVAPVIRLKAPRSGETAVHDAVQGEVKTANEQLDDMVLLRADGTPTYMLSVVVDDHDMAITHVIRGVDHLTNTFRQIHLYRALGWSEPAFGHIPLIHGQDGAKLSKRHGALGLDAYRDRGYLPEAMRNYLLRLGWGHGDDETIDTAQAIAWFDLDGVGRSPGRFDKGKLDNLNAHYLRQADDRRLVALLGPRLAKRLGSAPAAPALERLRLGMPGLKARAKTLEELADNALVYVRSRPLPIEPKAKALLDDAACRRLRALSDSFAGLTDWRAGEIEAALRAYAEREGAKLGEIAQPLRAALTGSTVSPGIFEVMEVLGRDETLGRIAEASGAPGRGLPLGN